MFKKKTSALFSLKLSLQRLRNRHRCSALHAPRRPSVQPHWLERRPPPGGSKNSPQGPRDEKMNIKNAFKKKSPIP